MSGQVPPKFRPDRLVEALDERFLTQADLARELGVPERTVNRWKLGHAQPYRTNARRLAEVFDRDPHWFYEPVEEAA